MARTRKNVGCPLENTLRVVGGRWRALVLQQLCAGVKRFNELNRRLEGISHRTLARQLRELERDGIVRRKLHAQVPPRVEYSLTPLGRSLLPVLESMHDWGSKFHERRSSAEDRP